MNVVCILIGIAFLIFVLIGWGQGLFQLILSVAALIVSMLIATYVAPYISGTLQEKTMIDDNIATYIAKELQYSDSGKEATRGVQVAVINELPLPETLKSTILDNNNSEMYDALAVCGVYDYISKSIAVVIINAAVFLILMLLCRVVFFVIARDSKKTLAKLPIVRSIDKIGGGILGAMRGLLWIWIFFLFLSITSTFAWSQDVIGQIDQSVILHFLYDHNVLVDILGDLTKVLFL